MMIFYWFRPFGEISYFLRKIWGGGNYYRGATITFTRVSVFLHLCTKWKIRFGSVFHIYKVKKMFSKHFFIFTNKKKTRSWIVFHLCTKWKIRFASLFYFDNMQKTRFRSILNLSKMKNTFSKRFAYLQNE